MKSTMNLEEHNVMKSKREQNIKIKEEVKITKKDLIKNQKIKKTLGKSSNTGAFRNNYKNYQYDYEEDFYEPY